MHGTSGERDRVRLSLELSPDLYALLELLAGKTHSSKSDVLRKAIALMDVAVDAKEHGQSLGVADRGSKTLVREIVGV